MPYGPPSGEMQMTKFSNYAAVSETIMDAIAQQVAGADLGFSARSVSRYVGVSDDRRVRISDHDATGSCGGGIVYEIDIRALYLNEITDEFGEFDGVETAHDWKIADWVAEAVSALTN